MNSDTLVIRNDRSSKRKIENEFIVSEELEKVSEKRYDELYRTLSNAKLDLNLDVPLYDIAWKHIIASRHGRLHELILLFHRLDKVISQREVRKIVFRQSIDKGYISVVEDIGEKYNIEIEKEGQKGLSTFDLLSRLLKNSILILPFLFDQIFSLFWKRISIEDEATDLAFIPSLGRLSSTLPVLDKLAESDFDSYKVIIPSKVSTHGKKLKWKYLRQELINHELIALGNFTNIKSICFQITEYVRAQFIFMFGGEFKNELNTLLSEESYRGLDKTIQYSIYEGFRTRVQLSIIYYILTGEMIDKIGPKKLVIGGLSPTRRAILSSALQYQSAVYYIPHGANAGGNSPNPPKQLTHFVSGKGEKQFYENSRQVSQLWNLIVTGRPYLTNLQKSRPGSNDSSKTNKGLHKILIATQPLPESHEFIEDVVAAFKEADVEIVLKVHPSESVSKYAQYESSDYVSVKDSDLMEEIVSSNLTLTINSNVGLESVILGTPTATMNKWRPKQNDALYTRDSPIPILRSRNELKEFVNNLDGSKLNQLLEKEQKFSEEYYELNTDAAKNIFDYIIKD